MIGVECAKRIALGLGRQPTRDQISMQGIVVRLRYPPYMPQIECLECLRSSLALLQLLLIELDAGEAIRTLPPRLS